MRPQLLVVLFFISAALAQIYSACLNNKACDFEGGQTCQVGVCAGIGGGSAAQCIFDDFSPGIGDECEEVDLRLRCGEGFCNVLKTPSICEERTPVGCPCPFGAFLSFDFCANGYCLNEFCEARKYAGDACTGDRDFECAPELDCEGGVCVGGAQDEGCTTFSCGPGLFCDVFGTRGGENNTCQLLFDVGDNCTAPHLGNDRSRPCAAGLTCGEEFTCIPMFSVAALGPCVTNRDCEFSLFCNEDGQCAAPTVGGQLCNATNPCPYPFDCVCPEGSDQVDGVCQQFFTLGAECDEATQALFGCLNTNNCPPLFSAFPDINGRLAFNPGPRSLEAGTCENQCAEEYAEWECCVTAPDPAIEDDSRRMAVRNFATVSGAYIDCDAAVGQKSCYSTDSCPTECLELPQPNPPPGAGSHLKPFNFFL